MPNREKVDVFLVILILFQMVASIDLRWPKATAASRPTRFFTPLQQICIIPCMHPTHAH